MHTNRLRRPGAFRLLVLSRKDWPEDGSSIVSLVLRGDDSASRVTFILLQNGSKWA